MKREDIAFLNQLVDALDEAELFLGRAYSRGDEVNFNKAKKFMIKVQKKIEEVTK